MKYREVFNDVGARVKFPQMSEFTNVFSPFLCFFVDGRQSSMHIMNSGKNLFSMYNIRELSIKITKISDEGKHEVKN